MVGNSQKPPNYCTGKLIKAITQYTHAPRPFSPLTVGTDTRGGDFRLGCQLIVGRGGGNNTVADRKRCLWLLTSYKSNIQQLFVYLYIFGHEHLK